jgi:hypothetical protein
MGITIPGSSPTSATTYKYWKEGDEEYRMGIRNGVLYTDRLKINGSWGLDEGVGWVVASSVTTPDFVYTPDTTSTTTTTTT